MASNWHRKSGSSDSNRPQRRARAIAGGRASQTSSSRRARPQLSSVRIGDLDAASTRMASRRPRAASVGYSRAGRIVSRLFLTVLSCVIAGTVAWLVLAQTDIFLIEQIEVQGVEHLSATEMDALVSVPQGTNLLNVDISGIQTRLLQNAWIEELDIVRVFPSTLKIVVTEREIAAVVEIQVGSDEEVTLWAIASDGVWLMSIPDQDSEEGQATSSQVYEDAAVALRIVDVSYGVSPETGSVTTDEGIQNALAVVSGLTTELADRVTTVSASNSESATLTLDNGVEIAFGTATDIRDKELICLELLEEHPDSIAYINVRNVDRPTYRAL